MGEKKFNKTRLGESAGRIFTALFSLKNKGRVLMWWCSIAIALLASSCENEKIRWWVGKNGRVSNVFVYITIRRNSFILAYTDLWYLWAWAICSDERARVRTDRMSVELQVYVCATTSLLPPWLISRRRALLVCCEHAVAVWFIALRYYSWGAMTLLPLFAFVCCMEYLPMQCQCHECVNVNVSFSFNILTFGV